MKQGKKFTDQINDRLTELSLSSGIMFLLFSKLFLCFGFIYLFFVFYSSISLSYYGEKKS